MPQKCFLKPNRSARRFWTAKRAGQACCYAIKEGATRAEIEAELAKCGLQEKERPPSEVEAALAVAAQALENSNAVFDADARALNGMLALPLFSAIALRIIARIPVAGAILVVALPALKELATNRLKQIAVQRASNDQVIAIVRRVAANESRFARTGTGR